MPDNLVAMKPSNDAVDRFYEDSNATRVDIVELLRLLWNRRLFIGLFVLLAGAIAFLVLRSIPHTYSATTTIMIDPQTPSISGVDLLVRGLSNNSANIASQIEVIQSPALAMRVIDTLQLDSYPEFNPALREASFPTSLAEFSRAEFVGALLGEERQQALADWIDPRETAAAASPDLQRLIVVSTFLDRLSVEQVEGSWVIRIAYDAENAELAPVIATTVAELYITQQMEAKFAAAQEAMQWLTERLDDLRRQTENSERAVEMFRASAMTIEGRTAEVIADQLTAVNQQVVEARAEYQTAEGQLTHIRSVLESGGGQIDDSIDSQVVRQLRQDLSQRRQRRAELLAQYSTQHPTVQNVEAEIASLRRQLDNEAQAFISSLQNNVRVATFRLEALEGELAKLQDEIQAVQEASAQLRILEQEAAANRLLFESFINRTRESEQVLVDRPDAWIISEASVPIAPSGPRKTLLMAAVVFVSISIAIGLVVLMELMETGFRTAKDVEAQTGASVVASVPRLGGLRARRRILEYCLRHPMSPVAESIRNIYTRLGGLIRNSGGAAVVMVTSAVPGEGKSAIATLLARDLARAGRRVALIDCNLRASTLSRRLNIHDRPGLSEVLEGTAKPEDALAIDAASGSAVLVAGAPVEHPQELLRDDAMRRLLLTLRPQFDWIVVDTPAVMAFSDALVVAGLADITLAVVRWRKTDRANVREILERLRQVTDEPITTVFNQTPAEMSHVLERSGPVMLREMFGRILRRARG